MIPTRGSVAILGMAMALWMAPTVMAAPAPSIVVLAAASATESEDHHEPALISGLDAGLIPALTTLLIFVCLLIVLGKFAWGPIVSGLKAREDKIRQDIADAEAASARAQATLNEYNAKLAEAETRVREMLSKAAADGEKLATAIRMQGQQEAEETRERAMRDIDAAREGAINEIYEQAATLATNVAEKILRRNLNAEDQKDLVNRSLEQLQTMGK